MALACQKNSYLRELKTTVKSCAASKLKLQENGKKVEVAGFEVILEDTVLFPEGGGQPDDRGTINDIPVLRITRRGADAVNFTKQEVPVGTEVNLQVDWKRRFDLMQQHSGQHLITAMAEKMYGCPTTTWNLGEKTSFLELDIPKLTTQQMIDLETAINEKIQEGAKVFPELYEDKNDPELLKARCRGLPDDHVGPVRVLHIEGMDSTLCCGTHVQNLSHLQIVKLLSTDKGKRKNSINLNFVVGGRVVEYLSRSVEVESALTVLLKGPLHQHYELAEKAVKGNKSSQKVIQNLLRDMAILEAEKFKQNKTPCFIYHRKEGDIDFMNTLIKTIDDMSVVTMLTAGEDIGQGTIMMSGPEDTVKELGPKVMEILEGKGGYSKGKFQGKVNKIQNRTKAAKLVNEHVSQTVKTPET